MVKQLSEEVESFEALALGVAPGAVEVVPLEPVVGSKVEVRRVVWGKLVAEGANCLGMGYRRKQAWVGRLDCTEQVLVGPFFPLFFSSSIRSNVLFFSGQKLVV